MISDGLKRYVNLKTSNSWIPFKNAWIPIVFETHNITWCNDFLMVVKKCRHLEISISWTPFKEYEFQWFLDEGNQWIPMVLNGFRKLSLLKVSISELSQLQRLCGGKSPPGSRLFYECPPCSQLVVVTRARTCTHTQNCSAHIPTAPRHCAASATAVAAAVVLWGVRQT